MLLLKIEHLKELVSGDIQLVQRFYSCGNITIDPSSDDNQAIRDASRNGYHEIVQILLQDQRVDPSTNNNNAIKKASPFRHYKVVRLLLQDPRVKRTLTKQQLNRFVNESK